MRRITSGLIAPSSRKDTMASRSAASNSRRQFALARFHHAVLVVTVHEALSSVASDVKCREHRDRTARVHERNGTISTLRVGVLEDEKQPRDDARYLRFFLFTGIFLAAGEGFEPSLTDPESGSVLSWLLLVVSSTAYQRRCAKQSVARCSPTFLVGWCTEWCSSRCGGATQILEAVHPALIRSWRMQQWAHVLLSTVPQFPQTLSHPFARIPHTISAVDH
jgi:hypothetical protein